MREARIESHGIPGRVYDPGNRRGVILLGHGGGYGKDSERFVRLCRLCAAETGAAVVCIDAVDHGERKPAHVAPELPAGWHSSIASQMVDDWQRTVSNLDDLGPPIAYVGFSMGAVFGPFVVASLRTIKAAVFAVGGIPSGPWVNDPTLPELLLDAASRLQSTEVLMVNKTGDQLFPRQGVHDFFDAIPGSRKRLMFWDGDHDDWPPEAIEQTTMFLKTHCS